MSTVQHVEPEVVAAQWTVATRENRHTVNSKQRGRDIAVLDLFSGCGGFSMGFEQAEGYEIVAACEWDPRHPNIAATYEENHPSVRMVNADITREETKLAICQLFGTRRCDVVTGGPPCVAYSTSGRRDPSDPRGWLFLDYLEVVRMLAPSIVTLENVLGILSRRRGESVPVIEQLVRHLADLGYHTEYRILNSADYGLPQTRRRVIVIGAKVGIPIIFPAPTHACNASPSSGILPWVSAREALDDLADAPEDRDWSHIFVKHSPQFLARIHATLPGESATPQYPESFRRLRADQPAPTVKGSTGGVAIHYSKDRVVTPREMARLQGFPDDYRFIGAKRDLWLMLSNAVPCGLARAVACSVREMLRHRQA